MKEQRTADRRALIAGGSLPILSVIGAITGTFEFTDDYGWFVLTLASLAACLCTLVWFLHKSKHPLITKLGFAKVVIIGAALTVATAALFVGWTMIRHDKPATAQNKTQAPPSTISPATTMNPSNGNGGSGGSGGAGGTGGAGGDGGNGGHGANGGDATTSSSSTSTTCPESKVTRPINESSAVSPHGLRITDLVTTSPCRVLTSGDELTVSYKLHNTTAQPIALLATFTGVRDPSNKHADFKADGGGPTIQPGQSTTIVRRGVLDANGTWKVWPCYQLPSSGDPIYCPNEWQRFNVTVG